jgi:excisionase family DNA binding protein
VTLPDRHLTVAECADWLHVEHKTVRRLIERGELPALRVGRVLRINPADLSRLAEPTAPRPERGKVATLPRPRPRREPRGDFARLARESSSGVDGSATVGREVAPATRETSRGRGPQGMEVPVSTSHATP